MINVASHLQKYKLCLKKLTEAQQLNMAPLDGLGNFNATRQLPSSALLSLPHLPSLRPTVCSSLNIQRINSSNIIQQGHHQNSSKFGNSSGTYHSTQSPRVQNVNQFQPTSSPLKPLLFPKSNFSAYMGYYKGIKEPAIGDSSLGSSMSRNSFQTACKFPNIPRVKKTDPSTGSCIIPIRTEPYYSKAARRHRFFFSPLLAAAILL